HLRQVQGPCQVSKVSKKTLDRAERAVKVFHSMRPGLTGYARALTGNPKVTVELSTSGGGYTNGTTIFFRPPITLGDPVEHRRDVCDKRGDDRQLLCRACRARPEVMAVIYH